METLGKNRDQDSAGVDSIVLISGLPRSGTSMMMQIVEAGGLPVLTDHLRTADQNNPRGYYEFERVKKLAVGDTDWIKEAKGKAVKVISDLLQFLPARYSYKVIFMQRRIEEVLASQRAMLLKLGKDPRKVSDEELANLYAKHLVKIKDWLDNQSNMDVLYVSYNEIVENSRGQLAEINRFLGGSLDVERMNGVIDTVLYRQRSA